MTRKKPLVVMAGEIRDSQGIPLFSTNLYYCSAVVVDTARTFYAHALPGDYESGLFGLLGKPSTLTRYSANATNALSSIERDARQQGINIRGADVYINAGSQKALEALLLQCGQRQMNVIVGNCDKAPAQNAILPRSRNVLFDPTSKLFRVEYDPQISLYL